MPDRPKIFLSVMSLTSCSGSLKRQTERESAQLRSIHLLVSFLVLVGLEVHWLREEMAANRNFCWSIVSYRRMIDRTMASIYRSGPRR